MAGQSKPRQELGIPSPRLPTARSAISKLPLFDATVIFFPEVSYELCQSGERQASQPPKSTPAKQAAVHAAYRIFVMSSHVQQSSYCQGAHAALNVSEVRVNVGESGPWAPKSRFLQ